MNELDSIEEMFTHLDMTSNMNSMINQDSFAEKHEAATAAAETNIDEQSRETLNSQASLKTQSTQCMTKVVLPKKKIKISEIAVIAGKSSSKRDLLTSLSLKHK